MADVKGQNWVAAKTRKSRKNGVLEVIEIQSVSKSVKQGQAMSSNVKGGGLNQGSTESRPTRQTSPALQKETKGTKG